MKLIKILPSVPAIRWECWRLQGTYRPQHTSVPPAGRTCVKSDAVRDSVTEIEKK